jgi:hypothetical protein
MALRPWVYLLLVLALFGCRSKEESQFASLGESVVQAVRTNDEEAFVRLHVQPGDKTPSGNYWLVTRAGGSRPDEAWNEELRRAFRDLSRDLKQSGVKIDSLDLIKIERHSTYEVSGDADRSNLSNLTLRVGDGQSEYLLTFTEGMLSQRGWVIAGAKVAVTRQ